VGAPKTIERRFVSIELVTQERVGACQILHHYLHDFESSGYFDGTIDYAHVGSFALKNRCASSSERKSATHSLVPSSATKYTPTIVASEFLQDMTL
jgi:hypothetical protein